MTKYTCTQCQVRVSFDDLIDEFDGDEDEAVGVASTKLCLDCYNDAAPSGEQHGDEDQE